MLVVVDQGAPQNLNLPRSALALWLKGKFKAPMSPISTASFIKTANQRGPACLVVFAPIGFAMRLLITSGSTITTLMLEAEGRTRNLEGKVIMNNLVDALEIMLVDMFLSKI